MSFLGKAEKILDWLGRGQILIGLLGALGAGTMLKAFLSLYTHVNPLWITPMWLLMSALVLAVLIWLGNKYIRPLSKARSTTLVKFVPVVQETIYGHTFRNQQLDIDNKIFDHCTFENVSFMYHGLGPAKFIEAAMKNNAANIMLLTDNDGIRTFMILANDLKAILGREPKTGLMDSKGNALPMPSPDVRKVPNS